MKRLIRGYGFLILVIVLALLMAAQSAASGPPAYRVVDLDPELNPEGIESIARDINARGQIVGTSYLNGNTRAVLWDDGNITDLGTLGGSSSFGAAINNRGEIVGTTSTDSGLVPFHWWKGIMTEIGPVEEGTLTGATDINDRGQIVGNVQYSSPALTRRAYLWDKNGVTYLGTLGGNHSTATAINNRGQITGSSTTAYGRHHAFLWQDGVMIDLGTLGGDYSSAHGINNRGQIVGMSAVSYSTNTRAFLWENGTMTVIDALYSADAINDRGQVIGKSIETEQPVLWDNGLVTSLELLDGIEDNYAYAINNASEIVGTNQVETRVWHAVLWTKQ